MTAMTEIRWHGRGGQGAKTAALLLAEAASAADMYVQGFPEYGPERMGAPVLAFNRLSKEPITLHCHVSRPSVVAVLDPTLVKDRGPSAGLEDGGAIVINSPAKPLELRRHLGLGDRPEVKVATVDATRISMDSIGQPIPNTPMIGAIIRVTGLIDYERFTKVAASLLEAKFAGRQHLVEGNLTAIARAYREVEET